MSDFNDLRTYLPPSESNFIVDVKGEVTKLKFEGEFICKIPTLKTTAQISKYQLLLNAGLGESLELGVLKLHKMIAYLKYCIVKAPKFWTDADDGYDLLDFNVIEDVYSKALIFENKWSKLVWGEKSEEKSEEKSPEKEKKSE